MPSIVDPAEARGGAWTVTRGLIKAIHLAVPRAEIDCVAVPTRSRAGHAVRQLTSVARSIAGGELPAKAFFTRSKEFRRRLRVALAKRGPDLVIVNGSDLLWVLSELPEAVPVVVVAQNIEQELYARQIARSRFASLLDSDLQKLRAYEWSGMKKAGRVIFLSDEDRAFAMKACGGIDAVVTPPIFDYEPAPRVESVNGRLRVGMFADFTWWPNRVSLEWFLKDVWESTSGNLELHLMGYGSDGAARGVQRVISHGFVHNQRDAFAMCDLMIAPIVEGAGVKVKVAEALFNRLPIVATTFATRGLPPIATSCVRICDTADEWIAFLNSDAAKDYASHPVPIEAAECFSTRGAADLLRRFLSQPGTNRRSAACG